MAPPSSSQLVVDDGEPMDSARHRQQMTVLIESLEYAWRDRSDFYVGGNMFLYFSETQAKKNEFRGPDVFVVMNTSRRERKAWVVWEEGGKVPDVIIELLSETTERVDRSDKMRLYARLKVGEYFLFDPFSGNLEGYELDVLRFQYVRKQLEPDGALRCEQLDLQLAPVHESHYAVEADWLRWLDSDGQVLRLPVEAAVEAERRAQAAAERARTEAERARTETERANHLEAELAKLRAKLANRGGR